MAANASGMTMDVTVSCSLLKGGEVGVSRGEAGSTRGASPKPKAKAARVCLHCGESSGTPNGEPGSTGVRFGPRARCAWMEFARGGGPAGRRVARRRTKEEPLKCTNPFAAWMACATRGDGARSGGGEVSGVRTRASRMGVRGFALCVRDEYLRF